MLPNLVPKCFDEFVRLSRTEFGREHLPEVVPNPLAHLLISFLEPTDPWRRRKLGEIALISSRLIAEVLSDPQIPASVSRAIRNVLLALAASDERALYRQVNNVAPGFFVIDPTYACNLKCPGCYANALGKGNSLSFDIMDWVISGLKKDLGMHFFVISGGEPFLLWDKVIAPLANKHQDAVFMIYTNGILINQKVISDLVDLGNVTPCPSIEGFREETDARRGEGHFDKMMRLMDTLKKAGLIFGFSATVTRQNAGLLASDRFISFYIRKGCRYGWFFLYIPIGRSPDMDLMVEPQQRSLLTQQANRWRRLMRKNLMPPAFLADFWGDGWATGGCIAGGRRYFHIDADGNIKPCVFVPIGAANIHDIFANQTIPGRSPYTSVAGVVCYSPVFVKYREIQQRIRDYTAPCPLIDHPKFAREVWQLPEAYAVQSTSEGFFDPDSHIGRGLDINSEEWRKRSAREGYLKGGPLEFVRDLY